jgi:hypothetical protein
MFCHAGYAALSFLYNESGQNTHGKNKHYLQRCSLLACHHFTFYARLDDAEKLSGKLKKHQKER